MKVRSALSPVLALALSVSPFQQRATRQSTRRSGNTRTVGPSLLPALLLIVGPPLAPARCSYCCRARESLGIRLRLGGSCVNAPRRSYAA
jgi:hypothetical protein